MRLKTIVHGLNRKIMMWKSGYSNSKVHIKKFICMYINTVIEMREYIYFSGYIYRLPCEGEFWINWFQ